MRFGSLMVFRVRLFGGVSSKDPLSKGRGQAVPIAPHALTARPGGLSNTSYDDVAVSA